MNDSTEYYEDTKPELHVSLDGFEGPLDLLLTLAKSQKVDLKKLQLGILAEQFLKYLRDQRFKSKLEFVGDYLVMASWLTLLKSQLIIPEDENKEDDVDKINELLALRLQRLSLIREKATWLFDRPKLLQDFFPSRIDKNEKVMKEDLLKVQISDVLKAYMGIVDKKNYEVLLGSKEEYLFLDKAINFIEEQVKETTVMLSFANLVKAIHVSSGINAKRCAASIFCGLLEYTKLGKISMKQEGAFTTLKLAKIRNEIKG
ncbi:segregation/condensation protein A [Paracoccaceae bacterium]|nr:segregation/condensation protein A [Paracoccaceae bacterium]